MNYFRAYIALINYSDTIISGRHFRLLEDHRFPKLFLFRLVFVLYLPNKPCSCSDCGVLFYFFLSVRLGVYLFLSVSVSALEYEKIKHNPQLTALKAIQCFL